MSPRPDSHDGAEPSCSLFPVPSNLVARCPLPDFDLAVIGAGPAGAAAAIGAARAGLCVLLIDRGDGPAGKIGETLPPTAKRLLDRLGVQEPFLATDPLPCYGNRSAWGGDGALAAHDFIRDPNGHGWQIDRRRFDAMLLAAARTAGACYLSRTVITGYTRLDDSSWRLDLAGANGSRAVSARLVVDASGRAAAFARGRGAARRRADRLLAVTASLEPAGTPAGDSSTLVEAVPTGWWYSALLADGRLAVAYMTDPDLLAAQRAWTAAGWQAQLAATVHTRLRVEAHDFRPAGAPRVAAAGSARLDCITGDAWLAAGDAAASFDPLSSYGLSAALSGGLRAAAAARAHLGGEPKALVVYAEQVERGYARYLWLWQAYYAQEQRWPDASFWHRRHAPVRTIS